MAAGAIQARINKAIEDRLRSDTDLIELMRLAGAIVTPHLPLYWWMAPAAAERPYLVYGPQERESQVEPTRCGGAGAGAINYEIRCITEGIDPSGALDILDRLATLLDGYSATIESVAVDFQRVGDVCYPDFAAMENGVTHTGLIYQVLVRP